MNKSSIINLTFGITLLNLAIVGLCNIVIADTFYTVVRLGALFCNCIMGILLLINKTSTAEKSPLHEPYWLGMIICNIIIIKFISPIHPCYGVFSSLFLLGLVIVVISLFSINNSFAVTAMKSEIKTRFAYSFVRHPIYLGESIMVLSCVLAAMSWVVIPTFLLYMYFTVKRIQSEESLLLEVEAYSDYCKMTRWRLLPFVW